MHCTVLHSNCTPTLQVHLNIPHHITAHRTALHCIAPSVTRRGAPVPMPSGIFPSSLFLYSTMADILTSWPNEVGITPVSLLRCRYKISSCESAKGHLVVYSTTSCTQMCTTSVLAFNESFLFVWVYIYRNTPVCNFPTNPVCSHQTCLSRGTTDAGRHNCRSTRARVQRSYSDAGRASEAGGNRKEWDGRIRM